MKGYLAGPMTGIPQFNFPAFDATARSLRSYGHDVVSPAELDSPEHRAAAMASPDGDPSSYNAETGETWGDLLARDVKLIADGGLDAVFVMDGWERSRGARLETFVASALCGLPVYRVVPSNTPLITSVFPHMTWRVGGEVPRGELAQAWAGFDLAAELRAAEEAARPLRVMGGIGDTWELPQPERLRVSFEPATEDAEPVWMAEGPGGEVRVVNPETGGMKGRKPQRYELLPWAALGTIAEVYTFGARKYDDHNWRKGYDWSLSFGALMRHLALFWEGEDRDPESGLPHLAHAGFHVLTLLTFMRERPELDDRATTLTEAPA